MDIFQQKKFLVRVVFLLTGLNLSLLGVVAWREFSPKEKRGPLVFPNKDYRDVSGILKKELQLTAEQYERVKRLREEFYEREYLLAKETRGKRDSMNVEMFNSRTNDTLVIRLAHEVADREFQKEMLRVEQSKRLKEICTADQLGKFEVLVKEIRDYFRPDNQPTRK